MVERIFEQQQSRREFLKYLGVGVVRTTAVVALNAAAFGIQTLRTNGDKSKQEQESELALEEGNDLEVKYFAKEILNASKRTSSNTQIDDMIAIIAGWYVGDALGGYLLRNKSKILNRMVGAIGFAGGKVIDIISTVIAVDQMNDPRFEKYGLGVYLGEKNPLLHHNPTRREVMLFGAIQTPFVLLGGFALPFLGRGCRGVVLNS